MSWRHLQELWHGLPLRPPLLPAMGHVLLHEAEDLDDAIDDLVGPWRAACDVHVWWDYGIASAQHMVEPLEPPARRAARAHREDVLRLRHLIVDHPKPLPLFARDGPRDDEDVRMAGRPLREDAEALDVEPRRAGGAGVAVARVARPAVEQDDPRGVLGG